ncbi:MAG: hypothetical protein KC910_18930, partial [Candidatus Eremiobacteraeota bacterium]|nr:hypothetical protein [Candidatus Eremiobacteraeota bacterium]
MMTENPMYYLLESKGHRDQAMSYEARTFALTGLGLGVLWLLSGIYLLATGGLGQFPMVAYACFQFMLWPLGVAILFGSPLRQLQSDASIHAALLNGRCYGEILGTLAGPRSLIDGV